MSPRLVARSPDLKRLQDDGYDLKITKNGTHLLVAQVPYVNAAKQVKRGTFVSVLELNQDRTTKPNDHSAYFIGERPCDAGGTPLTEIIIGDTPEQLAEGVTVQFRFSSKPTHGRGYADYVEKVTTYVKILSHEARAIEPGVTAAVFPVIEADEDDPVFKYYDSSASRAGIDALSPKLALPRLAIVGVGGTGSYVLDLVAKASSMNYGPVISRSHIEERPIGARPIRSIIYGRRLRRTCGRSTCSTTTIFSSTPHSAAPGHSASRS
jgi:hypothetical protein